MTEPLTRHADDTFAENKAEATANRLADELLARLREEMEETAPPGESYRRLLREALSAAAEARGQLAEKTRETERLRRLSVTDETTGLLNRRGFENALDRALARVNRRGETGLLLVIDLNDFKHINDTYGHQAGDLVLASVGTVLSRYTRADDSVARIGGDEFAVILGGADTIAGQVRAERLHDMLNSLVVPWHGERIRVSASIGSVPYAETDQAGDVMHRADIDMYRKKRMIGSADPRLARSRDNTEGMISLPHA